MENKISYKKKVSLIAMGLVLSTATLGFAGSTFSEQKELILGMELEYQAQRITELTSLMDRGLNTEFEISGLDEPDKPNELFNRYDITIPSGITLLEMGRILSGTAFAGMEKAFLDAEEKYQINALFLIGLCANESAWGTSALAQNKKNLTGFQAYNQDPYNSAKHFDSWEDCVDQTAEHIRNNYLNTTSRYYSGVAITDINKRYAVNDDGTPNTKWTQTILGVISQLGGI